MNEKQIRKVIESVLLGLAGGAVALSGCSGPGHRPDPNLPQSDAAQVADAGPGVHHDDPRRHRRRNYDPDAPPMPYMAPDAAPLHETLAG
jgi:hypothetical protein